MKVYYILVLSFFFFGKSADLHAQFKDPDSLFANARNLAAKEQYLASIKELKALTAQYPENSDYGIYLGRVYFWAGDYTESGKALQPWIEREPPNEGALNLMIQVLLARKEPDAVLQLTAQGIHHYPESSAEYLFYKVLALEQAGRSQEALKLLNNITTGPNNQDKIAYVKTRLLQKQKNVISLGYLNTAIEGLAPWHLAQLEYSRKSGKIPFSVRLNYGHVFGNNATQAEIDLYPKVTHNSYFYLNAGYSGEKTVFPSLRLSGEYYYNFKPLTASAGIRYLKFSTAEVVMFSGSLVKNFGDYQTGYRSFLVQEQNKWYPSHNLHLKKTLRDGESHIQLDLQYGKIPYFYLVTEEFSQINSYRAGINLKLRIKNNLFLQPILMYEREEFAPQQIRNRFNSQLIISRRF